jgi:rare lipoprotein A
LLVYGWTINKRIMKRVALSTFLVTSLWSCEPNSTRTQQAGFDSIQQVEPFIQTGEASYYARSLEGQPMASGDPYQRDSLVAAHRTLPLGTVVEVTNLSNGKTVEVEILDRGPHVKGRIIDLSRSAAKQLDFVNDGLTEVKIEVTIPAEGYTLGDSTVR